MLFYIYLGVCGFMGIVTIILYVVDKKKAIAKDWRIKEKTLLLSSFFFGALGGLIGMYGFRHKTKHWYFVLVNVGSFILQVALGVFLFLWKIKVI